jgi:hypothetical protein
VVGLPLVPSGMSGQISDSVWNEDALAYQVGVGTAEHGAFECLDAVDLAFDGAGAVGQAESGGDRGVVAAQACHEGVQAGRSSDSTACIQRVPAATTYRIQNRSPTR